MIAVSNSASAKAAVIAVIAVIAVFRSDQDDAVIAARARERAVIAVRSAEIDSDRSDRVIAWLDRNRLYRQRSQ